MERFCWNCKKPLNFKEFKETNRHYPEEILLEMWHNAQLQFYCCNCYSRIIESGVRDLILKRQKFCELLDNTTNTDVWRKFAVVLISRGNIKEAIQAYHRVLELEPQDSQSWKKLGHLHLEQNDYQQALKAYQKAIEHNIDCLYNLRDLKFLYKWKGNKEKIKEFLNKLSLILEEINLLDS